MTRLVLSIVVVLCWVGSLTSLDAQRPAKRSAHEIEQERIEKGLQRAMAEDGLGEQILTDSPASRSIGFYRTGFNPPTWGHNEPRGDVMGPWPDTVTITWAADGTGRLVIDAGLYSGMCRFDGVVGQDKVTVTGNVKCGGEKSPWIARVDRAARCKGFDGRWGGRNGPLVLTVVNDQVTGTFANGGEITGRLADGGRTLEGQWADATGHGRLRFTMAHLSESEQFNGIWTNAEGAAFREPWNGSCAGLR